MASKPHRLTRQDVRLVQASFGAVSPHGPALAARFYAHLFRIDPSLRRLFHGGMVDQGRKLVDMLALVAARLDRPEDLLPTIRELGVRHVGYRVEESHYATARAALLAALADVQRRGFDAATCEAWGRAYDLLADTMLDAARTSTQAAAAVGESDLPADRNAGRTM
jgi:nitric oxide dioxygenase